MSETRTTQVAMAKATAQDAVDANLGDLVRLSHAIHEHPELSFDEVRSSALAAEALARMEKHAITALLVTEDPDSKRLVGIIHLHDLLKAGVV